MGIFFDMNEQALCNMRFIHLEKKAYHQQGHMQAANDEKINFPSEMMSFYSFGFFDSVKCIKPRDGTSCMFNFEHHFAVSYPYKRSKNIKKVEQWFGLIPLEETYQWGKASREQNNDIFFFETLPQQMNMPFVGIILISLDPYRGNSNNSENFEDALQRYADCLNDKIEECDVSTSGFAGRLYITLNCADLCMVVRTNDIVNIHKFNLLIQKTAVEQKYMVNTTVMFMAQVTGVDDYSSVYESDKKKTDVRFIVRSDKAYPDSTNQTKSYRVNGNGKYVTQLSYEQYMSLFGARCMYCLNDLVDESAKHRKLSNSTIDYVESICHEREWFAEDAKFESIDGIALEVQKKALEENNRVALKNYNRICKKIEEIEEKAKECVSYHYSTLVGYIRLVQELLDTYSDLWYQCVSPSGYIFYSQLYIALCGVYKGIESLPKGSSQEISKCKQLVNNLQSIIGDINGYNKQVQFLNQDSVFYPSYEIQSKVNGEKYIMAYCSFLHLIFAKYYYEIDEHNESKYTKNGDVTYQSFPIAFLDIDSSDIETTFCFDPKLEITSLESHDKDKVRKIVSVHFPSYSYFSNVWTVVPLLVHEICHGHHYFKTDERNNAVISYIRNAMSQELALKMLSVSNKGFIANGMTPLTDVVRETFNESLEEMWEEILDRSEEVLNVDQLRMAKLTDALMEFYTNLFASKDGGIDKISCSDALQLQENAKIKLTDIFMLFNFRIMSPQDIKTIQTEEVIFRCWLNVLGALVNLNEEKSNDIIEDVTICLTQMRSKPVDEVHRDLINISGCFIELYGELTKKYIDGGKNRGYLDCNALNFHRLIQFVTYALARRSAKHMFNGKFLQETVFRSEEDIFEYLFSNLRYGITDPIELYYQDCKEVYNCLMNSLKSEKTNESKHMIVQCISEFINLTNSVIYVKEYIDYIVNTGNNSSIMDDDVGTFANIFLKHGHQKLKEMQDADVTSVFEKTSREVLMSLGLLADKSEGVKKLLINMISATSEEGLTQFITNKIGIYNEIFADCGMCSAMGFTAFGYMMFCTYIFFNMSKKSNLSSRNSNALVERIKGIAFVYFSADSLGSETEKNNFKERFFNWEMLSNIIEFLLKTYENVDADAVNTVAEELDNFRNAHLSANSEESDVFASTFNRRIRYWNAHILQPLLGELGNIMHTEARYQKDIRLDDAKIYECQQTALYAYSYLECLKNLANILYSGNILYNSQKHSIFGNYFIDLKQKMDSCAWVDFVRKQESISDIGKYYNGCVTVTHGKTLLQSAVADQSLVLAKHYKFVFEFYTMYRSAYGHVVSKSNPDTEIYEWFKWIDEYYFNKDVK